MNSELIFIEGKKINLRPLLESDDSEEYLRWLNNPRTNRYSNRQAWPTTEEALVRFINSCEERKDLLLAIVSRQSDKQVGNVLLGSINWIHRKAELSIMLGNEDAQGKGFASEAWQLMTRHAFEKLNIHRLEAGTIHPAMEAILNIQGWTDEGSLREAFYMDGQYVDVKRFGLLKKEFSPDHST